MIRQQIANQTKEVPDIRDDSFLSLELMVPHVNKTDSGRMNMSNSHILQAITLNNPQIPKIFSRYENMVGSYSPTFKVAKENTKILKITNINGSLYYLVEYINSKILDVIVINPTYKFTESYSAKLINHLVNSKVGDIIKEGDIIFRSTAYDEELNLMIGTNIKTVMIPFLGKTYEDAIVLSEDAVHKFDSTYTTEIEVMINPNELLLNLYGDKDNYKCFPDIGEKVNGRILLAKRGINYSKLLLNGSDKALRKPDMKDDKVYYIDCDNAIVTNIEIKANSDLIKTTGAPYYTQLKKYFKSEQKAYKEVIDHLDGTDNWSDDLKYTYKKFSDILNEEIMFEKKGVVFQNLLVKITVQETHEIVVGSKITNLYGKL